MNLQRLRLGVAALLVALPCAASAADWVVAEVSLNGEPRGTALLLDDGGQFYLEEDEARAWRLRLPASARVQDGRRLIPLSDLSLRVVDFDRGTLRLQLEAPAAAFEASKQSIDSRAWRLTPATWGGYGSYDLVATRAGGRSAVDGAFQLAGFSPHGALDAQFIKRNLWSSDAGDGPWVRQSTTYRRDWAESLVSLEAGDTYTRGSPTTRPVRLAGVWAGTNFGLRPGFITQPLPSFAGEAALPSTVQVFVNNQLRSVSEVPAGPFRLDNVPVISGAGDARMVVRDALGRESVISSSFYSTTGLLALGLSEFGVGLGRLRTDGVWGQPDYGALYGAAHLRRGVFNGLTLGMSAEFEGGRAAMAGGSVDFALPLGEAEVAAALSVPAAEGSATRGRVAVGYRYQDWSRGLALRYEMAGRGLVMPGEIDPARGSRRLVTASASQRVFERVTIGAAYIDATAQDGTRLRTANLSASMSFAAGVSVYLALNRVDDGTRTRQGVSLLASIPLGRDVYASASIEGGSEPRQTTTVQKSLPWGEGYAWRVGAGHDALGSRADAALLAQWSAASAQAEVVKQPGNEVAVRAQAAGSLAWVGGRLTAMRQVTDALVVVDIPGVPNTPVLLNNQLVGTTDADGRLLIPRLMSYVPSEIKIDATGLPPDAEIEPGRDRVTVVPGARSAVRAELGVRRVAAAIITVTDAEGRPLPAGAAVSLDGDAATASSVAAQGEFFVSGAPGVYRAHIVSRGRGCDVELRLPVTPAGQAYSQLGPLRCVP